MHPSQYSSPEPNLLRLARGPPTQYSLHSGPFGSPTLDDMGICAQLTILSGSRDPVQSLHTCGLSPARVPTYRPHSPYLHTHPRTCSLVIVSVMSHICTLVAGRTVGDDAPISAIASLPSLPTGGTPSPDVPSGSQAMVTSVTPSPDMLLSSDQLANLLLWSVPSLHADRSGGSYVGEGLPPSPTKAHQQDPQAGIHRHCGDAA